MIKQSSHLRLLDNRRQPRAEYRARRIGVAVRFLPAFLAASAVLFMTPAPVWAEWEFKPVVGVGATYTDNINLAVDSAAEDELVFEVSPSFSLVNDSKAWQVSLDYLMENLLFTRDSGNNQTFHSFSGSSISQLIGEELTLAINSRFYQQIIDPERAVRYSNISTSGNFSDAWVNSIAPRWTHNFGSRFTSLIEYRFARTDYFDRADDGRVLNDVETQTVTGRFGSQRRPGRINWDVVYNYQRAEPDMSREFEYERLTGVFEIPVADSLVLLAEGGAESDVLSDPSIAGLDESFWEGGVRWLRGDRTSAEFAVGHRFFGTTYRGSISHSGQRLTLAAGYGEDVSTFALNQIDLDSMVFFDVNEIGDPLQGIDNRVFVNKSFDASATWAMPRGQIRVSGFRNRREFVSSPPDRSELTGMSGLFSRELGPRTTVDFDVVWYRTEPGGSEPDGFEHSRISAAVTRVLGRSLSATATLRSASRSADFNTRNFDELAASLFFNWSP